MQKGYGTCLVCVYVYLSVCLCVCYHSSTNIAHFYTLNKVRIGVYPRLLSLINPSVQKLWHEKANMQMSMTVLIATGF